MYSGFSRPHLYTNGHDWQRSTSLHKRCTGNKQQRNDELQKIGKRWWNLDCRPISTFNATSGAGYVTLNHRQPCSCRRRSTCLEQSSSRSAPVPDIFYCQNTPQLTSVQHILPFSLTVSLTFLYRALEAACAACASKLALLHYFVYTTMTISTNETAILWCNQIDITLL